ncbi:MAG: ABC transporter ATP-binding protein [Candidatus Babeliales bacterium]|nr:ABC transporter ATP-binding protein [Candidatus Babeliales bacterium]
MSEFYPLQVNNLSKIFTSRSYPIFGTKKEFVAVDNISFTLKRGEILGFLGPNGAGKTTTIQMLLGILNSTHGEINYFGKNFAQNRSEILQKVTFASSYLKLPSRLKVWENLDIAGRLYNVPNPQRSKRIEELLKLFNMWDMRDKSCVGLSAGQITRIMLAKAFLPSPEIILLDEPTASLDPDVAAEVREFILKQKNEHGVSILFTSHNMEEVTQVCDRVLVLQSGKIIANNSPLALSSTISKARVNLIITLGIESAIAYTQKENISYKINGNEISMEVDESNIGQTLIALAHLGVIYTNVNIDKPSLEDYFLSISKERK